MRRTPLFHRIVLPATCLAAGALLTLTGWFAANAAHRARVAWDDRLDAAARASAAMLLTGWPAQLDDESQQLAVDIARETGLRTTLVEIGGRVIADSQSDGVAALHKLENHRDRVELVMARRDGAAFATRASSTYGTRFRYRAVRVDRDDKPLGLVRIAVPAQQIEADAAVASIAAWKTGGLAAIAAGALLWLILSRATSPVAGLAAAARSMAGGDYEQRLVVPTAVSDEFAVLGQSLTEIGKRLAKREFQLHRNWQTQATVLEGMAEGVVAVDAGERILFANRSAGSALGFNAQAIEGRTLLEAVRSHELRNACQQAMKTGQMQERELVWRAGKQRTFEAAASPLPGEPCPGAVLVLRDISELKRLENLRQQFVANVSHEFKTPLASIKAYAETLLNGALNDHENAEKFLRRIDEQSDRLNQLVRDMLALAHIETGQATLQFAAVAVARVTARCIADFEPQAKAGDVALRNEATDDQLAVNADEEALLQILSNLIDNAVKYTPRGGSVTVRARTDGDVAVIEVADTGVGIPLEHQARIFERFYRVDRARSRELGGTGLGLSIVKHLSQAMGGEVAVTSSPGKGAVFVVRLPLAKSQASTGA